MALFYLCVYVYTFQVATNNVEASILNLKKFVKLLQVGSHGSIVVTCISAKEGVEMFG